MALDDHQEIEITEMTEALGFAMRFHDELFKRVSAAHNKAASWENVTGWLEAMWVDGIALSQISDFRSALKNGLRILRS